MGLGMFCAIVAGMMISLQTVLNARMSHAFGAWATSNSDIAHVMPSN